MTPKMSLIQNKAITTTNMATNSKQVLPTPLWRIAFNTSHDTQKPSLLQSKAITATTVATNSKQVIPTLIVMWVNKKDVVQSSPLK